MLLPGILFALFLGGCWLYCLTDAVLTPAVAYRGLPKAAWVAIIAATFILGAVGWLIARHAPRAVGSRPARSLAGRPGNAPRPDYRAYHSGATRHPAGRSIARTEVRGPDDDPEFLRALDRIIRGPSADNG